MIYSTTNKKLFVTFIGEGFGHGTKCVSSNYVYKTFNYTFYYNPTNKLADSVEGCSIIDSQTLRLPELELFRQNLLYKFRTGC